MSDNTQRTAVEALAENAVKMRFEDLDKESVETIKGRVIDILGCAIGGANASGNPELIDLVKSWGGKGQATILMHGGKAPAHDAAMINAVMTRSYDFEEQSPSAHTAASVIPAALAMCEMQQLSGKDFITAMVIGFDTGNRINAGFDFDFSHGWDNIGSLHTFACSAAAGNLLKLTPGQMRNAFGLTLHQTAGSIASYWDCDIDFQIEQWFCRQDRYFYSRNGQSWNDRHHRPLAGPLRLLSTLYPRLHPSGDDHPGPGQKIYHRRRYVQAVFLRPAESYRHRTGHQSGHSKQP